jgi:hypothetical protein
MTAASPCTGAADRATWRFHTFTGVSSSATPPPSTAPRARPSRALLVREHSAGSAAADRVEWVEGDLGSWAPDARALRPGYLSVRPSGRIRGRDGDSLGTGVAPGGTLFLVGHLPVDPATGEPTPATRQVQVSVDDAVQALDPSEWQIVVAEERPRAAAGTGVDAVVRAVYQP